MSVNLRSISRGFRGNAFYDIFREGVKQGFIPIFSRGNSHAYLECPQCGRRVLFSLTGTGSGNGRGNKLADLRRHGFVWQGRPAEHTAPISETVA